MPTAPLLPSTNLAPEAAAVFAMASQTNALVTALQVPVDPEFKV